MGCSVNVDTFLYLLLDLMPAPATPGEDELQPCFEELQRQRGLTAPLQREPVVENYIILKNIEEQHNSWSLKLSICNVRP